MAYTKIKNIKTTISKAIDYISNPKKTNNEQYVYGYHCTPKTASIEFEFTEKMAQEIKGDYKRVKGNLAYHIIQSFDYNDIITPEEALKIGKKTAEDFTEGKYEYVIATHLDKTCIHNHIIFNSISFVDYKRFNSQPFKTVARLRSISDKVCLEDGLSVLKEQKGDSKSYYEWTMEKQGLSWKKTLKNIIDKNISASKSFDEFIELMRQSDYSIKQGKYIAFKHKGQDRYIRSYKLGLNYSEEKIKERIENKQHSKFIFNNRTIIKKQLPLSVWLKIKNRKEKIANIKEIANLIYTLEKDYNIKTFNDLKEQKGDSSIEYNTTKKQLIELETQIKQLQEKQRNVLIYLKYQDIYKEYEKVLNKKKYYNMHESEIILFESAFKKLKESEIENIEEIKLKNEKNIKEEQNKYVELQKNLSAERIKIKEIEKLENKLQNEKVKTKENEKNQNPQKKRRTKTQNKVL